MPFFFCLVAQGSEHRKNCLQMLLRLRDTAPNPAVLFDVIGSHLDLFCSILDTSGWEGIKECLHII
jgi:hypothetical protein